MFVHPCCVPVPSMVPPTTLVLSTHLLTASVPGRRGGGTEILGTCSGKLMEAGQCLSLVWASPRVLDSLSGVHAVKTIFVITLSCHLLLSLALVSWVMGSVFWRLLNG